MAPEEGRASVVVPVANLSFFVAILFSALRHLGRLTHKVFLAMTATAISVTISPKY